MRGGRSAGSRGRVAWGEDFGPGGQWSRLAGERIPGETCDIGPEGTAEGGVGTEAGQGRLADLAVLARRPDKAVAVAGPTADEMRLGGTDEHQDQRDRGEIVKGSQAGTLGISVALLRPLRNQHE